MGLFDRFRKRPPRPPDARELFVREVEAVARVEPGVAGVRRVPGDFAVSIRIGDEDRLCYLENVFGETREMDPESRRKKIERLVRSVQEHVPSDWETAKSSLLAVLKPSTFGAMVAPDGKLVALSRRPFLPGLSQFAVVDMEHGMGFVSETHLREWQVGWHEVWETAAANLRAGAHTTLEPYDDLHGPLFLVPGEDYASSHLLVPGWLASCAGQVEGRPLAIVPSRAAVLVGGDARPEMVKRLAEMAVREYQGSPRPISCALYCAGDGGTVAEYQPRADETANLVRLGQARFLAEEYAAQAQVLEQWQKKQGIDVFVAKYSLIRRDDGSVFSWCAWADGVVASLPQTDFVVAGSDGPDRWTAFVPFDVALRVGAGMIEPANLSFGPPRFSVRGTCSPGQRAALQAADVPRAKR